MTVVDLYAGAGGWDIAARRLGLDPIGIELDSDACATRAANGLATIRADLHRYRPPPIPLDGLIASPPCQIFSAAGSREGANLLPDLIDTLDRNGWAWPRHGYPGDARLLWAVYDWWDRHRPRWVACEQVRAVLPFWEALADIMQGHGWRVWTGLVDAADYGVPQNRTRAILLAHRDRPVAAPDPTHAREPQLTLFGPVRERWVSMADALGWTGEVQTRRWRRPDGSYPAVSMAGPAPAITTVQGQWVLNRREGPAGKDRNPDRPLDQPAPTITTSAVERNWCWDRPATTVTTDARVWPPGHKINGSDIARLGRTEAEARYAPRSGPDAVKVTPAQTAALQTFPPGWPFQGTKIAQARQIGNAVPPLLAWHLLRAVAGDEVEQDQQR